MKWPNSQGFLGRLLTLTEGIGLGLEKEEGFDCFCFFKPKRLVWRQSVYTSEAKGIRQPQPYSLDSKA
jgi:hypothetical protein